MTDNNKNIHSHVSRSALLITGGVTLSRILGYIRDIFFGMMLSARNRDLFLLAFIPPNLLRNLLGEGTLSAAFIPIFTKKLLEDDRKDAWRLASILMNLVIVLAAATSLILWLTAPWIIKIFFYFSSRPLIDYEITLKLTRWMLPFMIFVGISSVLMGVLNSMKKFLWPTLTSSILNLTMIIALILPAGGSDERKLLMLAVGVLCGGIMQILIQLPPLLKERCKYYWGATFNNPDIRKIAVLMLPAVGGLGVMQLSLMVDRLLANSLAPGSISALYYANRLMQLPLAMIGYSFQTAVFPTISQLTHTNQTENIQDIYKQTLFKMWAIIVPASVGLMFFGEPIIRILFQRGKFDYNDVLMSHQALIFYAVGIFAHSGVKITVPFYYSKEDIKTPVKIAAVSLVLNIVLSITLIRFLGHGGIALATSISAVVNFSLLYYIMKKKYGNPKIGPGTKLIIWFGISFAAGIISWWSYSALMERFSILISLLAGGIIYCISVFIFSKILRQKELETFFRELRQ